MRVIITKNETQGHIINKYKFKVFSLGGSDTANDDTPVAAEPRTEPVSSESATKAVESHAISSASKDALVESLLKKTDEMSSNFIKLQMKLEEQEENFKAELEAAKKVAYAQGQSDARGIFEKEQEAAAKNSVTQFSKSVQLLEKSASEFHGALGRIENELIHAAVDIAKEVVAMEITERSGAIAAKLASKLISDLQTSARVTLKVNPADHGAVSEQVGKLEYVDILSDSAISPGGVIAISDSGNIDSEIMKRYERVKKAALGG